MKCREDTRWSALWHRYLMYVVAVLLVGCGGTALPPPPMVYPVTGTVTMISGKRLNDGAVELQPTTSSLEMAFGEIGTDGTYVVKTPLRDGRNIEGAEPGEYQIIVHGHSLESGSSPSQTLPQTYQIEKKANHFDLIVRDADW